MLSQTSRFLVLTKKVMASGGENVSLIPIARVRRDEKIDLKQSWRIVIGFFTTLASCTEQYPLEVQIIFHKKQMLQASYELLKEKGVVVNCYKP